jgi:hypothetical protein
MPLQTEGAGQKGVTFIHGMGRDEILTLHTFIIASDVIMNFFNVINCETLVTARAHVWLGLTAIVRTCHRCCVALVWLVCREAAEGERASSKVSSRAGMAMRKASCTSYKTIN